MTLSFARSGHDATNLLHSLIYFGKAMTRTVLKAGAFPRTATASRDDRPAANPVR